MEKKESITSKGTEIVSPISVMEKRQVAKIVEFCGITRIWVLSMKNHKIHLKELELYGR
jgi:hypothetical protein